VFYNFSRADTGILIDDVHLINSCVAVDGCSYSTVEKMSGYGHSKPEDRVKEM